MRALCAVDGCERQHHAKGWCGPHYKRWLRHGDPTAPREYGDPRPVQPIAAARQIDVARLRREERFEDARDLIAGGVHPDWIPARLGCTREALAIQARRHEARDIYEWARTPSTSADKSKPCPDCGADINYRSTRCVDCAYIARWVKGAA